jgi:FtsP/CotA-like multicopper oxidase with cupredoxin domain
MNSREYASRPSPLTPPSRRTFVKGLAMGGVVATFDLWRGTAWAQPAMAQRSAVLPGSDFDLRIGESLVNFTGSPRIAHTVNGSLPAPTLRWKEGDTVTLRVSNSLRADHASIHWHGILLPANMDGVPGLSFHGIGPGETYVYRFQSDRVARTGTTATRPFRSSSVCTAL